jgi:hypothetical protein
MAKTKDLRDQGIYSITGAAEAVGASRAVLRLWIASHGLPTVEALGKLMVHLPTLRQWMADNRPRFGTPTAKVGYRLAKAEGDVLKGGTVYALTDPRPEYAKRPIRYIGQTSNLAKRQKDYRIAYRHGRGHNPALANWFRKLHRAGLEPGIEVLEECLFGVGVRETSWIKRGRDKGWSLLNCTDGGECRTWGEKSKAAVAERSRTAWQRPEYRARHSAAMARLRESPERVAKRQAREAAKDRNRAIRIRNMAIAAERKAVRQDVESWVFVPLTHKGRAFIPLTSGKWAMIDVGDWDRVGQHRWFANRNGKQWRAKATIGAKTLLPRFILAAKPGERVEPADGNQLNCTRKNLAVKQAHTRTARHAATASQVAYRQWLATYWPKTTR